MKDERLLRLSDGPSPDLPSNYYYQQQQPGKQQRLYFQPNQAQALRLVNPEMPKGKKGLLRFEAAANHERLAPV